MCGRTPPLAGRRPAQYLARFADRRRTVGESLPDDYPHPVTVTGSLSIERANQLRPAGLAGPALELAALLDPNGIPAAVFTTDAARAYLATTRGGEEGIPARRRRRGRGGRPCWRSERSQQLPAPAPPTSGPPRPGGARCRALGGQPTGRAGDPHRRRGDGRAGPGPGSARRACPTPV
jgi:hypothetical protein